MRKVLILGAAAAALYASTSHSVPALTASSPAAKAVSYTEAQTSKPYLWGGPTAPGTSGGFDCSGLAQAAWNAAGVNIARTSQQQWATEKHVTDPGPGDLVFFAGSDGTPSAPGHVGVVTDPARHLMVDAYGSGEGIRAETYGLPTSAPGLTTPAGFTDPAASGSAA